MGCMLRPCSLISIVVIYRIAGHRRPEYRRSSASVLRSPVSGSPLLFRNERSRRSGAGPRSGADESEHPVPWRGSSLRNLLSGGEALPASLARGPHRSQRCTHRSLLPRPIESAQCHHPLQEKHRPSDAAAQTAYCIRCWKWLFSTQRDGCRIQKRYCSHPH